MDDSLARPMLASENRPRADFFLVPVCDELHYLSLVLFMTFSTLCVITKERFFRT